MIAAQMSAVVAGVAVVTAFAVRGGRRLPGPADEGVVASVAEVGGVLCRRRVLERGRRRWRQVKGVRSLFVLASDVDHAAVDVKREHQRPSTCGAGGKGGAGIACRQVVADLEPALTRRVPPAFPPTTTTTTTAAGLFRAFFAPSGPNLREL